MHSICDLCVPIIIGIVECTHALFGITLRPPTNNSFARKKHTMRRTHVQQSSMVHERPQRYIQSAIFALRSKPSLLQTSGLLENFLCRQNHMSTEVQRSDYTQRPQKMHSICDLCVAIVEEHSRSLSITLRPLPNNFLCEKKAHYADALTSNRASNAFHAKAARRIDTQRPQKMHSVCDLCVIIIDS